MQICQPQTDAQSWNTDNWCWVDWTLVGWFLLCVLIVLGTVCWLVKELFW